MISVEGNKFVENELMFARNTVNILFKGCSHGTIATAIFSTKMNCIDFNVSAQTV